MSQDFESPFEDPASPEPLEYQQPDQLEPLEQGDGTGGIIPYKNGHALIAYYLGVFSIIPCLGLLLAIPALILGIIGLKKRKANPLIKGSVHAWVGIIMGGIFTVVWGGLVVMMIVGGAAGAMRGF